MFACHLEQSVFFLTFGSEQWEWPAVFSSKAVKSNIYLPGVAAHIRTCARGYFHEQNNPVIQVEGWECFTDWGRLKGVGSGRGLVGGVLKQKQRAMWLGVHFLLCFHSRVRETDSACYVRRLRGCPHTLAGLPPTGQSGGLLLGPGPPCFVRHSVMRFTACVYVGPGCQVKA